MPWKRLWRWIEAVSVVGVALIAVFALDRIAVH
jgi:hypothetical protein